MKKALTEKRAARQLRNMKILNDFLTYEDSDLMAVYKRLADRYGLSVSTVMRIIRHE